jgi:pimeloyl-ACP methyl ester carboxylesterase
LKGHARASTLKADPSGDDTEATLGGMTGARSSTIVVDGLRTHYLEAGDGYPVVMLHSGEYGASATLSWEHNIDALAEHFRVVAPDWMGFGESAKVYDFESGSARRVQHMRRFLDVLGIDRAHFVGSSMGASVMSRHVAAGSGLFPASAMVMSAGGGFVPNNEWRRSIVDYDCTFDGMREILRVLFHDQSWAADDTYVQRRFESALRPGAWEATAAARFRSPVSPPRTAEGQEDRTPYEQIAVPTFVIAGAEDKLREHGYAEAIAARIPGSRLAVYEECGHLPHIENAERFNREVVEFLLSVTSR